MFQSQSRAEKRGRGRGSGGMLGAIYFLAGVVFVVVVSSIPARRGARLVNGTW